MRAITHPAPAPRHLLVHSAPQQGLSVRLLLDTHIAIWALTDDPQLSGTARTLIGNAGNQTFVSAATVWEIAPKHVLQRFGVPFPGSDALGYFSDAGHQWLDVTPAHAAATKTLPPLHADPLDRLRSHRRSSNRCAC